MIPDKCPESCKYKNNLSSFGQNSVCIRCPVLNCKGDDPLFPIEEYNQEWLKEWEEFFQTGKEPQLRFKVE